MSFYFQVFVFVFGGGRILAFRVGVSNFGLIPFWVGVGFLRLRLEFITFCLKLLGFGAQGLGFGGVRCNYLFGFRVGVHNLLWKIVFAALFFTLCWRCWLHFGLLILTLKSLGLIFRDDFERIHIRIASKSEGLGLKRA